jgi:hypothetical protein
MGDGINLYFKMLGCFAWMFFLTFIVSLPSIVIYYSQDVVEKELATGAREWERAILSTTLGNVGNF